jgi:hypothetical protein
MTISALSVMIREDLGDAVNSPALTATLEQLSKSGSSLVGIAIGDTAAFVEAFDADQLGTRELDQRSAALREYPDARYYLCRDGRAKRCSRRVFFEELWMRVIERAKSGKN